MPVAAGLRPDWEVKGVMRQPERRRMPARLVGCWLAIAAAWEWRERSAAAKSGALDRQRLHDWMRRFDAARPDGPIAG